MLTIYEYSKQSKNTESLEDLIENAKKSHNNRHEDKFQKIISKYNMMMPNDDLIIDTDGNIKFENFNHFDFERKEELLKEYQKKRLPYINNYLQNIPEPKNDLYEKFNECFKKLINQNRYFSSSVDQIVEFQINGKCGGTWQINFKDSPIKISKEKIGEAEYRFTINSKYMNLILNDKINWEDFLLSMRLKIWRKPDIYNGSLFALLQYGRDPLLIQRAENVNDANSTDINTNVYKSNNQNKEQSEYEECLSCQ